MKSDDRARVMVFVTVFDVGGTERQIVALARGLDRSRFDLRVGCFRRTGAFLSELEKEGVPVVAYPIRSLHSLATLRSQLRLVRDLRSERIDIVHAFNFYPNMFAVPAARLAGVPAVIATLRDMGDLWTPMQRRSQRWVCRLAHRVVGNAEAVAHRALLEGYDAEKLCVIRNGIDLSGFPSQSDNACDNARQRALLGLPAGAPVVALFSRLSHPVKGVDCFLEAAARVAAEHRNARFLIVGDGPLRAGLMVLADRLGLGDRVTFTGFRSDVAATMSAVSISVLPSLSEGLSNVLLESMACSLPVVSTRVGGTPEVVVDGGTGLLVPPRDPGALARAIGTLLDDPLRAQSLGRAGRLRVERLFHLGRMVRETETLYGDLLERAGTRGVLATRSAL